MKKKFTLIIFFAALLFAFVGIVLLEQREETYRSIYIKDEIEISVLKTRNYKSGVIINDSLTLPGMSKRIVKDSLFYGDKLVIHFQYLKDVAPPYKIIKKKNNDTIVVCKLYSDTLFYKLIQ